MRIVLAPIGTRGDVQPMVALGVRLRARGHDVLVVSSPNFQSLVAQHDLPFEAVGPDTRRLLDEHGTQILSPARMVEVGRLLVPPQFDVLRRACHNADMLVGTGLLVAGPSIAEELRIRFVWAAYFPNSWRTRELPCPQVPWLRLPPALNLLTWSVWERVFEMAAGATVRQARSRRSLPAVRSLREHFARAGPVLLALDPVLAGPPSDWSAEVRTTGFWFLDDDTPLEPRLDEFLGAGPPPVYVGFGSAPSDQAARTTAAIAEAAAQAGCRVVISAGWADLGAAGLPEHCLVIGATSHRLLFPKVAAVVHHGGAGTVGAAARAGVPQIVAPHMADQFFWARRIYTLGLGPAPLSRHLSTPALAAAFRKTLGNPRIRENARRVAEAIGRSDGTGDAVRFLEAHHAR